MRAFLVLAVFLEVCLPLSGQNLRVWIEQAPEGEGDAATAAVQAYIVNEGENSLRIATRAVNGNPVIYRGADGGIVIVLFFEEERDTEGHRLVRPVSDYGIVELRTSEATRLGRFQFPAQHNHTLGNVTVEYKVSEEFAARHGVWGGRLSAQGRLLVLRIEPAVRADDWDPPRTKPNTSTKPSASEAEHHDEPDHGRS